MRIRIIGLGWFGKPLATGLLALNYQVSGTTRTEEKKKLLESENITVSLLNYPSRPEDLDADIVVLNIPPFEEELEWFKSWPWNPKSRVIFISSTSVYPTPDSKNGKLLLEQEDWVKSHFSQWIILRFGGLLGNERHPGKHLSGKKNLPGKLWPVNLIHLDDAVGATIEVIQKNILNKTIHVVSPYHPTREEFYTNFCREKGLPLPEFNQDDFSSGKIVPAEELLEFYRPVREFLN